MIIFDKEKNKLDFQIDFTPENIWEYYEELNKFMFFGTNTHKNIPILIENYNLLIKALPQYKLSLENFIKVFSSYAEGFLKGFETEFKPYIFTAENQKEMILKTVSMKMSGFSIEIRRNLNSNSDYIEEGHLSEESFYKVGEIAGKNYKAWMILLETPKYYAKDFPFNKKLKKIIPKTPYKSFNELYQAATYLKIIKPCHPGLRFYVIRNYSIEFHDWLKKTFNIKEFNNESYSSFLTMKNFKKFLQSSKIARKFLESKNILTENITTFTEDLPDINYHIAWLKERLNSFKDIGKKIVFLKLKLDAASKFINNISKFNSDYPSIDIDIEDKILLSENFKIEIDKKLKELYAKEKLRKKVERKAESNPKNFEELFFDSKNENLIETYIGILREVYPRLIDSKYNYIVKSAGPICIWVDELRLQGIMKLYSVNREITTHLLIKKFKNLSMDASTITKPNKRANDTYRDQFQKLITKIKLSQSSPKGKLGK